MELDKAADEPRLSETIERGFDFMLESQFEKWSVATAVSPQWRVFWTFNDSAINDCIVVLQEGPRAVRRRPIFGYRETGRGFIMRA